MAYNRTLFSHGFKVSPLKDKDHYLRYTYFVRPPRFRAVVFKGGGGRTWVYQNLLHMLEDNGLIDNVKEYGGSSAGAYFAVLAAMPLKQKERSRIIEGLKFHHDILDDSTASKLYQCFTFPLYLISKPLAWISDAFSFAAEQCYKVRGGSLLGVPLDMMSSIVKFASGITHPECAAGIYNLLTRGGVYRGNELQKYIKKSLYYGTKKSIERFLNGIKDKQTQQKMIHKLLTMDEKKCHKLILDITRNTKTQRIQLHLSTKNIYHNAKNLLEQLLNQIEDPEAQDEMIDKLLAMDKYEQKIRVMDKEKKKFITMKKMEQLILGFVRDPLTKKISLQLNSKNTLNKTKTLLERLLNTTEDPQTQQAMINTLLNIDQEHTAVKDKKIPKKKDSKLISHITRHPTTKKLQVGLTTKNITFKHFHQLATIKGLGFKDVFLTATRCKETPRGRLKILNHKKTPNKPIHLAVRMSMSAPLIYQTVYDNGKYYMDGGCADNFPMQHTSHRSYANFFEKEYLRGKHRQDLDVLGARVEYAEDLDFIHHPIYTITGWWNKLKNRAQMAMFNFICGMDIYTPENKNRHIIKKKYPLRVLQLYDHGVGFTEVGIDAARKNVILQCEEKRIQRFLNAHSAELTYVNNYDSFSRDKLDDKNTMSLKRQKKFLHFLCNKSVPDEQIFSPEFSEEEATACRQRLIHELNVNLKGSKSAMHEKKRDAVVENKVSFKLQR